ncbi:[PSI+] inducibility protein 3 [Grifola frondosa]|uniref:[PSI+] inducibility protein 3 n=1 Tax=Grifola frondosa TaxID=5627 RepID=A0A1C7M7I5_GRIFR|nr:[PSI+] inducibility protein 3 [Grifola frondosa]
MSTPSDPQAAALLAHVVSQTEQNISFLASQNYISSTEAADIIARLPKPQSKGAIANSMSSLTLVPARSPSPSRRNIPPPPPQVIEIIDETNTDWWTGKCRGRQGLFPSNHVEKLDSTPSPAPPPPMMMPIMPSMPMQPMQQQPPSYLPEKAGYVPYGQAPMPPPAPEVQVVQVQQEPKKHRFGKLGNTMANSAAGGVGFGAGAAIGSGIVNAIF